MKKIISMINTHLNMRAKVIAFSVCIIFLTSALLSALFYQSNQRMLEEKILVISEETIVQTASYIDSELAHIIQLVNGGIIGYDLFETVQAYLSDTEGPTFSITMQEMLTQLVIQSDFVQSAQLITSKANIGNLTYRVEYDLEPILAQAKENASTIYWHDALIIDENLDKKLLIVIIDLTDTLKASFSEDVFLVLNLSYDQMARTLTSLESNIFGTVRLVNQNDAPFDASDILLDDYEYVLSAELAVNGWKIQTLQTNAVLLAEYYATQRQVTLWVLILAAVIVFITTLFVQTIIVTPLHKLTQIAKKMQHRDYSQQYQTVGTAEIDLLGAAFNQLETELIAYEQIVIHDKLVIQKEAEQKRQIELNLLQAQMNPHFLYNTLDSIYWYAQDNETDKVCNTIIDLSRLLRITLSKGNEFIPLSQEIEHVSTYLKIQKQIFGEKFVFDLQVAEDLPPLMIVKMILQPLVENCIIHGFADRERGGLIIVKVFYEDDALILQVKDNGVGFAQSARNENKGGSGFALNNLSQRLALYYKEAATLGYQTDALGMTVVEIQLQEKRKDDA